MSATISASERLLDLVIALTRTSGRMTKSAIRRQVHGYVDSPSDAAFERMFERDKETLRQLGIPLVTMTDPTHGDDVGYRIDSQAYAMPEIDFTPAEMGVLAIAASAWRDAVLRGPAERGVTKLRGLGAAGSSGTEGLEVAVRPGGEALEPLFKAIQERRPVSFRYRAASHGRREQRIVEPWRLLARGRGWYLVGFDRDRGAQRVYRLSRIEPPVTLLGEAGEVAIPADAGAPIGETSPGVSGQARLAVRPERGNLLRRRATRLKPDDDLPGWDILEVPFDDDDQFAAELAGMADAVIVLEPAEVRRQVMERLRAVAQGTRPAAPARGSEHVRSEQGYPVGPTTRARGSEHG